MCTRYRGRAEAGNVEVAHQRHYRGPGAQVKPPWGPDTRETTDPHAGVPKGLGGHGPCWDRVGDVLGSSWQLLGRCGRCLIVLGRFGAVLESFCGPVRVYVVALFGTLNRDRYVKPW
jgi:hypothetical protein